MGQRAHHSICADFFRLYLSQRQPGMGLLGCEGTYFVGQVLSCAYQFCQLYTPRCSNMMMLNGAFRCRNCEKPDHCCNAQYRLCIPAFATSIESSSPAILQFAIDGTPAGLLFALSATTCNWQEFYEIWNSGSNTSIEICITNQNTAGGGNDFALDDISFGPI